MPRIIFSLLLFMVSSQLLFGQLVISQEVKMNATDQRHALWTARGDQLFGKLQAIDNDSLYFLLEQTNQLLSYHRQELRFVGLAGEPFPVFSDISTRYRNPYSSPLGFPRHSLLYSSSALAPETGGSYRNNILLINELEFHPSKHFSVGIGAIVPPMVILRASSRLSLSSLVHLGLTANHYIATYEQASFTHPYLVLTLGDQNNYLNFTYGRWFQRGYYYDNESFPIISLGGSYTISAKWRVFAEMLVYDDNYDTYLIPTGYFNYLRRRSVYGIGLWGIPDAVGIPILPWVSYSYIF